MYFFFSGEGATDVGTDASEPGPITFIADQIIEEHFHYSFIESKCAIIVHPKELERIRAPKNFKPSSKRSIRLPSLNVKPETQFQFANAKAFSQIAKGILKNKNESNAEFVAVMFHDSDSSDKKEWSNKRNSILWGFRAERIENQGVAAVAQPLVEAWWLSAIYRSKDAHKNCTYLESTKYGNGAEHALKTELEEQLETTQNCTVLTDMIKDRKIDYKLIDLDSFIEFKKDFANAVGLKHIHYTEATQ